MCRLWLAYLDRDQCMPLIVSIQSIHQPQRLLFIFSCILVCFLFRWLHCSSTVSFAPELYFRVWPGQSIDEQVDGLAQCSAAALLQQISPPCMSSLD